MSTIYTVAQNLRNTIAGKEKMLVEYTNMKKSLPKETPHYSHFMTHWDTTLEMLQINIDELKRILADVEKACEEYNLMGWQVNPERMGQ